MRSSSAARVSRPSQLRGAQPHDTLDGAFRFPHHDVVISVRALCVTLAAIALTAPAVATASPVASFSVAVTRSASGILAVSESDRGTLVISGSLSPSANGAAIVGVYAPVVSAGAARASLLSTTRRPDGMVVVDARLGVAVLLDALAPGAERYAAGDLTVVVSAT
ncbi:MAG: hypothetical protein JWO85_1600 [Candidatus Eremiobacteraeota bacterium]|jgi:hypothetical protein|nr:hypothetical protein [Candidatus Eremiobacteraeota bacterium]